MLSIFRASAVFALLLFAGCAMWQGAVAAPSKSHAALSTDAARVIAAPLPFRGRLAEGDPTELPPMVAAALAPDSPITFSYREQLTHDERHVSLIRSAFAPTTYAGAPLGDYGVGAFASLTITRGDTLLAQYVARAYVSKSYNLYAEPTHRELDEAARAAVHAKLDTELAADATRLAATLR